MADDDDYRLADTDDPRTAAARDYFAQAQRELKREERARPQPVKLPYFTGVLEFPWYPSTLGTWLTLSLLMLFTRGVFSLLNMSLMLGGMGIQAFAAPALISLICTMGYACACGQITMNETAEGTDVVERWPAALAWKQWCWSFVYVLVVYAQAGAVAALLTGWLVWWSAWPVALVAALLFPVCFVSAQETGSFLAFSPVVLRTLLTRKLDWITFYGVSLVLHAAYWSFAAIGTFLVGGWIAIVALPLLAALVLIQFRLMGRLVWRLGE